MAHVAKFQGSAAAAICGHNERKFELRGFIRENIDNSKIDQNYNLAPERDGEPVEFINQRIESLDLKRKPRKDAIRMCDWVVTMPQSLDKDKEKEFFENTYRFLEERYGRDNVISAWVHKDETTPHMHFAFVPVTEDGRLCAKDVLNRSDLQSFHSDLQKDLEARMGCKVEVLLDDDKQGEKELSHLGQKEYIEAKQRLERLRCDVEEAGRTAPPENGREVARINREGKIAEGRIGELEQQVERARSRVAALEQEARDAQHGTLGLEKSREEISGRVGDLAVRCRREGERIEAAERKCESLRATVETLRERARGAVRAAKAKIEQLALSKPNKALQAKLERLARVFGIASPTEKQKAKPVTILSDGYSGQQIVPQRREQGHGHGRNAISR